MARGNGARECLVMWSNGCVGSVSHGYAAAFRDNEIGWEALPRLTAEDLMSCARRPVCPGCGASRAGEPKTATCWHPSMAGFTEGFDTANLKEAAALLTELA